MNKSKLIKTNINVDSIKRKNRRCQDTNNFYFIQEEECKFKQTFDFIQEDTTETSKKVRIATIGNVDFGKTI